MSKLLVVTGASRGIGFAAASRFGQAGYDVVNISRKSADLDGVINLSADFSELDWVDDIADALRQHTEKADQITLVHSAGMLLKDQVGALPADQLRRVIEVNVVAASMLNDMLIPQMGDRSAIIYVGSTLSEKAVPGNASYVISKHAVIGLMRSTCQDLAGSGIHTACVCPGFTDTEMLRDNVGNDPEILKAIAAMQTFGRLVEPGEIAEAIYAVATQPVFNGSVIHANLGQVSS